MDDNLSGWWVELLSQIGLILSLRDKRSGTRGRSDKAFSPHLERPVRGRSEAQWSEKAPYGRVSSIKYLKSTRVLHCLNTPPEFSAHYTKGDSFVLKAILHIGIFWPKRCKRVNQPGRAICTGLETSKFSLRLISYELISWLTAFLVVCIK